MNLVDRLQSENDPHLLNLQRRRQVDIRRLWPVAFEFVQSVFAMMSRLELRSDEVS